MREHPSPADTCAYAVTMCLQIVVVATIGLLGKTFELSHQSILPTIRQPNSDTLRLAFQQRFITIILSNL